MNTKNKRVATLPATPIVPALRGEEYPPGLKPGADEVVLRRTITVSENVRVIGTLKTKEGQSEIEIDVFGKRGYGRAEGVPFTDLDTTVAAMNFVKAWLAGEVGRYVVQPPPPPPPTEEVEEEVVPMPASKPAMSRIIDDDDDPLADKEEGG